MQTLLPVKHKMFSKCKGYYMLILTNGYMISEHRYNYIKAHKSIPAGYTIHHIDGNKLNNHHTNLIALTEEQHRYVHEHLMREHLHKTCTYCKQIKSINEFYCRNKTTFTSVCKECTRLKQNRYNQQRKYANEARINNQRKVTKRVK